MRFVDRLLDSFNAHMAEAFNPGWLQKVRSANAMHKEGPMACLLQPPCLS